MKSTKLGQSPAFSCGTDNYTQKGISIRLYLAGMAMQGILANRALVEGYDTYIYKWIAEQALAQADELLRQENIE